MRSDQHLTGDADVRVGALQPRPLVQNAGGDGAALPPVGRPPKKRHGRTVALVAVGMVATAVAARIGFEQWDRTTLHSGGPVSGGAGINGAPVGVGQPLSFGGFHLYNKATKPAVIEDVRIVGLGGGFEVLDVRTTPLPYTPAAGPQADQSDGFGSALADRHVVPVPKTRGSSGEPYEGLGLIIRARATVPGVASARGVEVTYRVGHRRYRRADDSSMYLCAPREQFLSHNCGGDAEGQFGDAVADFPVR